MYSTKNDHKLITHHTTCGTWYCDSVGGYLAKAHAQYKDNTKKSNNKRKSRRVQFGDDTHTNPVIPEDDASDSNKSDLELVAAFG
eukprot:10367401-Ditylum_brightwellii.AAC.2